jgi:hypothetical protein
MTTWLSAASVLRSPTLKTLFHRPGHHHNPLPAQVNPFGAINLKPANSALMKTRIVDTDNFERVHHRPLTADA